LVKVIYITEPLLLTMEGYKPLKGSLYGSFGFKLDAKGILTDKSIVYCFHCEQSFSYHRSKTSLQYHLRKKHPLEQQDAALSPEQGMAKRARITCAPPNVGGGANANPVCSRDLEPSNSNTGLLYSENNHFGDRNRSGTCIKESNDKRTGFLTDLILEVVYRDLQPLSVVEERGFRLLLSCLEPQYPVPSPSQLGSLIWHRYDVLKRQLQQCLQSGLAPRGITLCTEYWRSLAGCEVGASGRLFFTVSAHFIDKDWRLARCVLQTRPVPDIRERACGSGFTQFENLIAGPGQSPPDLPESWVALHCAGEALKLCIQEGLWMEPVRQALSEARRIISHFQHDTPAAAALIHKAEAANKAGACLVLDDPGRWATTINMCESLLGLKWVVSSVLEEQKAAPNLVDHQWRLLQELVSVLKTMRIAASFLNEDINVSISALMPCLHGVFRVLRQHIAESSCPVARGVMETVQSGMERQWRLGEEEASLDSPAVLSSFLDPRFKELRFLSPHARSKLHDKVKELLSAQAQIEAEEISREHDKGGDDEKGEEGRERGVTNMRLINSQSTIVHLQPPSHNHVSPVAKTMYDILLGEDPTVRMPEIHQQLENYIAEPLCKRSLSPLHWWRSKEHRFPAVARLARIFLAIPTTAVAADRAFAPRETTVAQRRAILGPQHLDHILFLHQNNDYVEKLMGGSTGHGERDSDRNGAKKTRETLYQSLVSYESILAFLLIFWFGTRAANFI
uniref:Zinc finger BED-type containing 4-like 2 n=1 Tax=Hucho hucho TaxID=62062 RepID=A0A4W5K2U1_9TELE